MSDDLFRWPIAATHAPLDDHALLAAMLRFEVALAQTQAGLGLIPHEAAAAIGAHAPSLKLDAGQLARDGAQAGSLAIPFVAALRAHLRDQHPSAADWIHFGTTSQDLLDTALVLCLQPAAAALDHALARGRDAAIAIARAHRATPVLARTLMQPAGVTTIGFKAAQWAHSLAMVQERLTQTAQHALAVSLGGATGNLAAYGEHGDALRAALASTLGLRDPGVTWHAQRERLVALGADLGIAGGAMAKIAGDLALMMQAEVGEASESAAGGSTAMPHKRNPVLSLRVLAATQPLPGLVANLIAGMRQEHERALGSWQAEMDQYRTLTDNALAAGDALAQMLEGVRFDARRCRANIDVLQGVIFSEALTTLFAPALGKQAAQDRVATLCAEALAQHKHLRDLAMALRDTTPALAGLAPEAVEGVFDVAAAAGPSARAADSTLRRLAGS